MHDHVAVLLPWHRSFPSARPQHVLSSLSAFTPSPCTLAPGNNWSAFLARVLPSKKVYVNGFTHIVSCVWLLSITFLRLTYVIVCISNSFLFMTELCSFVYYTIICFLLYQSVDICILSSLRLLWIRLLSAFLCKSSAFGSLNFSWADASEWNCWVVWCVFHFIGNCPIIFQSACNMLNFLPAGV